MANDSTAYSINSSLFSNISGGTLKKDNTIFDFEKVLMVRIPPLNIVFITIIHL